MAILVNKPTSVSADSTTSLELNKTDLQAKLVALGAGAYWENQATWKGVAFLFENASKQKAIAVFNVASGVTTNLSVSEYFVDGAFECKRIDVLGFANDFYTIYRSDFGTASEFDITITDGYASGGGGGGGVTPVTLVDIQNLTSGVSDQSGSGSDIRGMSNTIIEQGITYRYEPLSFNNVLTLPAGINTISSITVLLELDNRSSWVPVNSAKIVAEIYELNPRNVGVTGIIAPTDGALPVFTSEIAITELNTSNEENEIFTFNANLDPNKRYGINFAAKIPQTDYTSLNAQSGSVLIRLYFVDANFYKNTIPQLLNYVQKNTNNGIYTVSRFTSTTYNWNVQGPAQYAVPLPNIKVMGTTI